MSRNLRRCLSGGVKVALPERDDHVSRLVLHATWLIVVVAPLRDGCHMSAADELDGRGPLWAQHPAEPRSNVLAVRS